MNVVFSVTRDLKGILVCHIIGVAVCLSTTDILLIRFGPEGANYTMFLSLGVASLCLLFRLLWFFKKQWPSQPPSFTNADI